ncbi:hypothetical protein [Actinacidiphila soli]|uniref:hypothetical protein n=1 Tax=Actinacidiphila soli TaxID=2487275 RepID=UPI002245A821|nr:hypothetical protein [Actinacidiphila soli]
MQLPQLRPWEPVEEGGKESSVRRGDARPVHLPLQDRQLWRSVDISMSLSTSLIGSSRMKANTLDTAR